MENYVFLVTMDEVFQDKDRRFEVTMQCHFPRCFKLAISEPIKPQGM
jgi:hypothetical protein